MICCFFVDLKRNIFLNRSEGKINKTDSYGQKDRNSKPDQ